MFCFVAVVCYQPHLLAVAVISVCTKQLACNTVLDPGHEQHSTHYKKRNSDLMRKHACI